MIPVRQLSAATSRVAIPALSTIQAEAERFAQYYLHAVSLITWVGTPIFGFLFAAAEPVVVTTLGSQWRDAAPVFKVLCICALGQLLLESTIWLLVSQGQSQRLFRFLLVISPVIVGSFVIGLPFGIQGVALSGSVVQVIIFPWILRFAFRGSRLTLARLGRAILCPISLGLGGVLTSEFALRLIAPRGTIEQLLVVALGFASAYSFSVFIPLVRAEIMSLKRLLREVRVQPKPLKPYPREA